MRVIVNFPKETEAITELENRVAAFHATLVVEKIKQLDLSDEDKEKVLKLVLEDLEHKSKAEIK